MRCSKTAFPFLIVCLGLSAAEPSNPTAGLPVGLLKIDNSNLPASEASADEFLEQEFRPLAFQIYIVRSPQPDTFAWRIHGIPVHGVYPFPISAEDLTRMHGNDERVAVKSLEEGTKWIYETPVEVASR